MAPDKPVVYLVMRVIDTNKMCVAAFSTEDKANGFVAAAKFAMSLYTKDQPTTFEIMKMSVDQ